MEKVYLALEMAGLTVEKAKLENDCREGASEFKTMEVRIVKHSWIDALFILRSQILNLNSTLHCSKDAAAWSRERFS